MRILLDTNIFIPLEDSSIELDQKLADFNQLATEKHQLLIHPATLLDLERDKDSARRKIIQSRLPKYKQLNCPPALDKGIEIKLFGIPKKGNDTVDNLILFALYSNCSHWLITEDTGIHKKAKRLGIDERVFTIEEAISILSAQDLEELNLFPNIQDLPCYSIDLSSIFFDSLRDGYSKFDSWFQVKCAQEARHAWVWFENNDIQAICIYKQENSPIVTNQQKGLPGKVLKLCTFKVAKQGYRIGELLLKQAFNYTINNEFDYVYATVEPDRHIFLENLLKDYGFDEYGVDEKGRDIVYVKNFPKEPPQINDAPLQYAIKYYPHIRISNNDVYLVPIQPQFHKVLFPELERQPDLFEQQMLSAGNAIKQAYLCKSPTKSIKPGDILFFYRTGDEMAITTYGIVDQFHIESKHEEIMQWVSKRTVYTQEEIQKMDGYEVKVILFRFIRHLTEKIHFRTLKKLGLVNGSIQSITKLDKDKVGLLLHEARIEDSTLLN